MSLDNGKIMLSWPFLAQLLEHPLPAPTLRLLLSMMHRLDLTGARGTHAPQTCPTTWAPCTELRSRVGPRAPNGARDVRAAAEALRDAGIVDTAQLLQRNTVLQWRFSEPEWQGLRVLDWSDYVLVDLEEVGRFRARPALDFYLAARKIRGASAPQLYLPYDAARDEDANNRQVLAALRQVAEVLDIVCHVGLRFRSEAPIPDLYHVKISHGATQWRGESYRRFAPSTKKVWRVDAAGHRRVEPGALRTARADPRDTDDSGLDRERWGERPPAASVCQGSGC